MREIEIKARLEDIDDAIHKLRIANVTLGGVKEQHDVVYCLPEDKLKENSPDTNWLRIRTENKTTVYFTLKRSVSSSLDSIEHETIVANAEELEAMLRYMGYVVYSDLVKIRRTGHIGDVELCVDEVPLLGSFIELEKLCDESVDGTQVEAELMHTLDLLGITYGERVMRGYDELMNEHLAKADQGE